MTHKSSFFENISLSGTCPVPELDNGFLASINGSCTSGECTLNTTLSYLCNNLTRLAYNLHGSAAIKCLEQNTWYPSLGICVRGE